MKQGFAPVSLFENGKANLPIFSALLTVASPGISTERSMVNLQRLIVNGEEHSLTIDNYLLTIVRWFNIQLPGPFTTGAAVFFTPLETVTNLA